MLRGYRSAMTAVALNSDNITKIGVIIIIALVVIGALLSIVISALIARIVILVLVIGLSVFVWQQRTHLKDKFDKCDLQATFFGVHFDAPQSIQQQCQHRARL
jgi:protein-S-isoprenylcysteine O-methyltransferase Ste14